MSRLIVNADDLGYTPGVDRAILALHASEALSSATMMASGASHRQSAALLPERKPWVGCHVVLVDGVPSAPAGAVPSLLCPAGTGMFRPKLGRFVRDLLAGRIRDGEIEAEAIAQIRSLQALGLTVTHVDTHKHTHLFPRVLRPLLRAALQCGIRAIRNPFEPAWARSATRAAPLTRRVEVALLAQFRAGFLREVERAGLRTTAGALGVLATGTLGAASIEALLRALAQHGAPGDTYELVCHPGFHDQALDQMPTRLRAAREVERQALLEVIPRWTGQSGPHALVSFAEP